VLKSTMASARLIMGARGCKGVNALCGVDFACKKRTARGQQNKEVRKDVSKTRSPSRSTCPEGRRRGAFLPAFQAYRAGERMFHSLGSPINSKVKSSSITTCRQGRTILTIPHNCPASIPFFFSNISITATPVSNSPFNSACWIGAGPR
jgi:hypothetical protein